MRMHLDQEYYTIPEVGKLVGRGRKRVGDWVRLGEFETYRPHPSMPYLISRSEVRRIVKEKGIRRSSI